MKEKEEEKELEVLGNAIDHLIATDINARELSGIMYKAAREKVKGPLTLIAAKKLKEALAEPGSVVFFMCSFPMGDRMLMETDGPPGAAALARGLNIGLEAIPVVFCEPQFTESMEVPSAGQV